MFAVRLLIICSLWFASHAAAEINLGNRSHFSFEIDDEPSVVYAIDIDARSLFYFWVGYSDESEFILGKPSNGDVDTDISTTEYYYAIGYRFYIASGGIHDQSDYYLDTLKLRTFLDFEYGSATINIETCSTSCINDDISLTKIAAYYGLQYMLTDYFSVESKIGLTYASSTNSSLDTDVDKLEFPEIKLILNYHFDS